LRILFRVSTSSSIMKLIGMPLFNDNVDGVKQL
jgi:hypothetical protein